MNRECIQGPPPAKARLLGIAPPVDPNIDPRLSRVAIDPDIDPNIDPSLSSTGVSEAPRPPLRTQLSSNSNEAPHHTQLRELRPATPRPSLVPPEPQPVIINPSKNRKMKILLSLDGDGIRGLSQVLLVESLVNAVCTTLGVEVEPYQIFNMIGGVSLGGVLALMLIRLRMRVHTAREAYKLIAREVFPNKRDFFTSSNPNGLPITHDGRAVEDAIRSIISQETQHPDEILYDEREDSADVFVVATKIDIGTNKPVIIRSYKTRRITGPDVDENITICEAMKATCIAPCYMQPRSGMNWRPVIAPGLVDHGTVKNNPIRETLYECRKLYTYGHDMMVIISIGTGSGLDPARETMEMAKNVADRKSESQKAGEKFETEHRDLMARQWMKYFRFNVPNLDDVPLEEWCHEEKVKEKTLEYLADPDVVTSFYRCVDDIVEILTATRK
ncbi:hypothetical protein N0V90_001632 [Kalmusia sp. IMI 367209]|nr:hypothetical protein N0V90_001632 [Kalmusia sp. IMI 367209]